MSDKKALIILGLFLLGLTFLTVFHFLKPFGEKSIIGICKKEGEYVDIFKQDYCCEGLKRVPMYIDKECSIIVGPNICINCGDGICKDYESICSCPDDCS